MLIDSAHYCRGQFFSAIQKIVAGPSPRENRTLLIVELLRFKILSRWALILFFQRFLQPVLQNRPVEGLYFPKDEAHAHRRSGVQHTSRCLK
jgi:hypothetical protein